MLKSILKAIWRNTLREIVLQLAVTLVAQFKLWIINKLFEKFKNKLWFPEVSKALAELNCDQFVDENKTEIEKII